MPYLRMEPDNTLAQTLGSLGSNLQQAFDPMRQIQGQNLLSEMQERRWELQQKQQLDAANQNAANVFLNSDLPFDPATKASVAAGLRSGTLSVNNYIDALTKTGSLKANQTAAQMYATTHQDLPPEELASDQAQILQGKSSSELDAQRATTTLTANKTAQTLAETAAARTPGAKAAAANNQPDVAVQLDAADALSTKPPITGALSDPDVQRQIDQTTIQRGIAKIPVTADMPVSSGLAAPQATAKIVQQNLIDQSKNVDPTLIRRAIPPTDPLTGLPVAPDTPGGFTQPAVGPDTGAITATEAAKATGKAGADYANTVLQGGISEGQGAATVLNDVNQLRYLAKIMNADGPMNQLQSKLADQMYQRFGLTLTPGQSAREVFNNYVAALMGTWRRDEGIQRLALPEIQLGQLSLPNPNMSLDALNGALDFVQAKAQISDKVGHAALKAWTDQSRPIEQRANDFLNQREQFYAPEANPAATIRKEREGAATINSPTGPKSFKFIDGVKTPWPPPPQ